MADTPSVQEQLAASIASAGTADYKPVESEAKTDATTAPSEVKPTEAKAEAATTERQPVEAAEVQTEAKEAKPEESKTDTPDNKETTGTEVPIKADASKADGTKEQPKGPDEDSLMREALGLPKVEPETVDTLKARYEASSKEAHRLIEEDKAKAQALADAGVEFTRTKEGTFALKANQKYLDSLKPEDVPDIYGKLAAEDQEVVTKEVAAKIARMAIAEVLPKRPIAKATGEDAVLPGEQVDRCFSDLGEAKLSDGQPRYADIKEDSVVRYMRELYDRPEREGFRKWMNQSADNFKQGLSMIHAEVFRVRAPMLARKKDAEAAMKTEQEKLKKKPATVNSGAGVTPDAMRHRGTSAGAQDPKAIALQIASAKAT
jgi:hypothetical protein